MTWWIVLLIFIGYIAFEFINSIFFNWRIILLTEKKYSKAGIFDAINTILFLSSLMIGTWIGNDGAGTGIALWIVPIVAIAMAIGNFLAAFSVPYLRKGIEYIKASYSNKQ